MVFCQQVASDGTETFTVTVYPGEAGGRCEIEASLARWSSDVLKARLPTLHTPSAWQRSFPAVLRYHTDARLSASCSGLSVGPIVGIAVAAAAVSLLFIAGALFLLSLLPCVMDSRAESDSCINSHVTQRRRRCSDPIRTSS